MERERRLLLSRSGKKWARTYRLRDSTRLLIFKKKQRRKWMRCTLHSKGHGVYQRVSLSGRHFEKIRGLEFMIWIRRYSLLKIISIPPVRPVLSTSSCSLSSAPALAQATATCLQWLHRVVPGKNWWIRPKTLQNSQIFDRSPEK